MVTPDATHRSAAAGLCARCSRRHPTGRACFPRVRWVTALGEDLAEAAASLRGVLDALRGDRDPARWPRRVAAGGGVVTAVAVALRATGVL